MMMAMNLAPDVVSELIRCALCHDQCACACPLVQVSRRTLAYPSRLAQVALAAVHGEIPLEALDNSLSFCVDCGLCLMWCVHAGKDPGPPDIAGNLRTARSALGLVTEPFIAETAALMQQLDRLTPRDGPTTCFVAGQREESLASARLLNRLGLPWTAEAPFPIAEWQDAGCNRLIKVKLAALRESLNSKRIIKVLVASPRDERFLREGLDMDVDYIGSFLADRLRALPRRSGTGRIAFYPSAYLLRRSDGSARLDRWLSETFGRRYIPLQSDAKTTLMPAAAEGPGSGISEHYLIELAQRAWERIASFQPDVVLTTDPYTRAALRRAGDLHTRIVDLLIYLGETQD